MRVLHVIPSVAAADGGPSKAIMAMAKALENERVPVTIATTGGMRNAECRMPNSKLATEELPNVNGEPRIGKEPGDRNAKVVCFKRNLEPYKVSLSLAKWLGANISKFDLVHVHALFSFASTVAARAARRRGVPYIVRPLGVLNQWGMQSRRRFFKRQSFRLIELPILLNSAAVHYTSDAERNEAILLDDRLSEHPSVVIPLPVASLQKSEVGSHRSGADDLFAKFPQTKGKRIILFLSRIDPKKGLELLLDAFAEVRERDENAVLVIAGEGDASYVQGLKNRAATRNGRPTEKDIIWAGHLSGELKAAAFAAADVFVLPSASENFGIAAAEAMAAGVTTIVSEEVALSKDIREYDAGIIVKRDAAELAKAIGEVLSDKARTTIMAANGQRLVKERYSPDVVGKALMDLYEDIVSSSGRSKARP